MAESEERPSFPDLHKIFDDFLTQQTQDSYPYMEVLSKPYHLDETSTAPANDPDPTPINLDIQITDFDEDEDIDAHRQVMRPVGRSISHRQPRRTEPGLTPSTSNLSLRSLQDNMQAELDRQANWLIAGDGVNRQNKVDTRYVDSPTSFTRNDSRRQMQLNTPF